MRDAFVLVSSLTVGGQLMNEKERIEQTWRYALETALKKGADQARVSTVRDVSDSL